MEEISEKIAHDILNDKNEETTRKLSDEQDEKRMLHRLEELNNTDSKNNILVTELDEKPAACTTVVALHEETSYIDKKVAPREEKSYIDKNVAQREEKSYIDKNIAQREEKSYIDKDSVGNSDNNIIAKDKHLDSILLKAVNAQAFIPENIRPYDEKESSFNPPLIHLPPLSTSDEEQVVLNVLHDVISTLMEDPGDYEQIVEHLTDHLKNFVTREKTLKEVVHVIITQV